VKPFYINGYVRWDLWSAVCRVKGCQSSNCQLAWACRDVWKIPKKSICLGVPRILWDYYVQLWARMWGDITYWYEYLQLYQGLQYRPGLKTAFTGFDENWKNGWFLVQNSNFKFWGRLKTERFFWFIIPFFWFIDRFLFQIQILNENNKPISFLVYHLLFPVFIFFKISKI
jgi:hypothetical protein